MRVEITNIETTAPRALAKARQTKPFVTRLGEREYRVTPRCCGKQKRIVTFTVEDGRRFAECRSAYFNDLCPAVENEKICYHIAASYRRHVTNARRDRERLSMKDKPAPVIVQMVVTMPTARPLPAWYNAPKIRGIRI
jgi:hypothetical protein